MHHGSPVTPPPTLVQVSEHPYCVWHALPSPQLHWCLQMHGASTRAGIGAGATPSAGGAGGIGDVVNVPGRYALSAQRMRRACSSVNVSMQSPSEYAM